MRTMTFRTRARPVLRGLLAVPAFVALVVVIAIGLEPASPAHTATTFSLAGDFSPTANPNDPWSYGFRPLGGAFTLYDHPFNDNGLDAWGHSVVQSLLAPSIAHNGTDHPITGSSVIPNVGVTWAPGQLTMHPGQQGQQSVARFTVPAAGDYQIDVTFSVADLPGGGGTTTTDVHVFKNSVSLFDGDVSGYVSANDSEHFSAIQTLAAGDIIEFAVGFGNGNFYFDNTFVDATIFEAVASPTPTPTDTATPTPTSTPTPTRTATPTPTPTRTPTPVTPHPPGVGGTVKLPPAAIAAEAGTAAEGSGWATATWAALAGGVAAAAISVGGWYARRRWLR